MGIGPVPEQREDGCVIEARRRGEPAEFPGVLGEREISVGKGDEAGSDFHRRGSQKNRKQKTFQKRENKNEGGETPLLSASVRCSVRLSGEQGARRHGESSNIDFNKTHWAYKHKEIKRGRTETGGEQSNTDGDY